MRKQLNWLPFPDSIDQSTTNCAYWHTNTSTILHQSTCISKMYDLVSSFLGRSQQRSTEISFLSLTESTPNCVYCHSNTSTILHQSTSPKCTTWYLRFWSWSLTTEIDRDQLPFSDRIDSKLCVLAYKYLHDSAPVYISEMYDLVSSFPGRSQLRSASSGNLIVPVIRTKTIEARVFFYSCPSVWNSLPSNLKNFELFLPMFKNQLKTNFFTKHC